MRLYHYNLETTKEGNKMQMNKLVMIVLIVLSMFVSIVALAQAQVNVYTLKQLTPAGYVSDQGDLTWTYPVVTIGSGNHLTCGMVDNFDGQVPQTFLNSCYDCNDPTGCTASNTINTFVPCTAQGYAQGTANTVSTDCMTVDSSIPGATYVTETRSRMWEPAPYERWEGVLIEVGLNAPMQTGDVEGCGDAKNSKKHTMCAVNVTGSDAVVQLYAGPPGPITVSGNCASNLLGFAHFAFCVELSGSSTVPIWTSASSESAASSGIVIEQAASKKK